MALSRIHSVSLIGLEGIAVDVEVDAVEADPSAAVVHIVGLPDAAVRESKERVIAALRNSGHQIPAVRCTINLAPGDLRKEGSFYDLPIALGLLRSLDGTLQFTQDDYLIVGELGLSGETRPLRGALAMAMLARSMGKKGILLPAKNAAEAAAVSGIDVVGVASLQEAIAFLKQPSSEHACVQEMDASLFTPEDPEVDLADVRGQDHVKRALEIAAAGGHNVLLSGPPGSGKTMLAKALAGIMPDLSAEEALDATKIHSISGILPEGSALIRQRPFRSPHHTVSYAGLIGGGAIPRPGEVSLAHNGILFLDELPEFSRHTLEVLRQPLEDLKVTVSRAQGNLTFPANFVCVAAMNPCPCGYLGHPDKPCRDTETQRERYRGKISGPLLDRLDMHIDVPALRYNELKREHSAESSAIIKERVTRARKRQRARLGAGSTNAAMTAKEVKQHCKLDDAGDRLLQQAIEQWGLSARAYTRVLRVARTIADLKDSDSVGAEEVLEAVNFRTSLGN